jgi:signal transduction histidine kinase
LWLKAWPTSWLRVAVADDGHGFDQDVIRESGLRGLRDRIEALGGRVEVVSRQSGTRIDASLPTSKDSDV